MQVFCFIPLFVKIHQMKNIVIFASGSGTNAENIANYFCLHKNIKISYILSNKKDAFVLERAKKFNIPTLVFERHQFYETNEIVDFLKEQKTDFIVLSGFLWLVPESLIEAFPNKIINIHPALLPKYGGKGFYGEKVHQAVIDHQEKESGITIHYVNKIYDSGTTLFQATCPVVDGDTAETLAQKVHQLEYKYFPTIIEKVVLNQL